MKSNRINKYLIINIMTWIHDLLYGLKSLTKLYYKQHLDRNL